MLSGDFACPSARSVSPLNRRYSRNMPPSSRDDRRGSRWPRRRLGTRCNDHGRDSKQRIFVIRDGYRGHFQSCPVHTSIALRPDFIQAGRGNPERRPSSTDLEMKLKGEYCERPRSGRKWE